MRPLLLALLLALSGPAVAQAQAPVEAAALRLANERLAEGDAAGAVEVLSRARAEAPTDRLDLNLAIARASLGQLARASRTLRRLVATSGDPLVREAAREQLGRLDARVATLVITADGFPASTRVTVDGRPELEREVIVDPGDHLVEARGPEGAILASANAHVEAGQTREAELAPARRPAEAARPRRPRDRPEPAAPSPAEAASAAAPPVRTAPVELSSPAATEDDDSDATVWWVIGGGVGVTVLTAVVIGVAVAASSGPQPAPGDAAPIFVGGRP